MYSPSPTPLVVRAGPLRWEQIAAHGIVPAGQEEPIGIIQIWSLDSEFQTAEWGFVIDNAYWGTGLFVSAARLLVDFAFEALGVHRLEARAVSENGRVE